VTPGSGAGPTARDEVDGSSSLCTEQPVVTTGDIAGVGIGVCAAGLEDAQRRGCPVPATQTDHAMDLDTGYAVQLHRQHLAVAAGERIAGYKIGLTSTSAQLSFSAIEPISGYLSATSVIGTGEPVCLSGLIEPKLEVELAFILGEDLDGRATAADVWRATAEVALSFEIVDSRWQGGVPTVAMLVADNSNAARAVIGQRVPISADLRRIQVGLAIGDFRVEGHGENVMGDPAHAVAWLAMHLDGRGQRLMADHIVLSGTLTAPVPVKPGDIAVADFGQFGHLSTSFSG